MLPITATSYNAIEHIINFSEVSYQKQKTKQHKKNLVNSVVTSLSRGVIVLLTCLHQPPKNWNPNGGGCSFWRKTTNNGARQTGFESWLASKMTTNTFSYLWFSVFHLESVLRRIRSHVSKPSNSAWWSAELQNSNSSPIYHHYPPPHHPVAFFPETLELKLAYLISPKITDKSFKKKKRTASALNEGGGVWLRLQL